MPLQKKKTQQNKLTVSKLVGLFRGCSGSTVKATHQKVESSKSPAATAFS